jgi:hypothetical protein
LFLGSSKMGASEIDILSFVMKLEENYPPLPPLTQKKRFILFVPRSFAPLPSPLSSLS